MLCCVVLSCVLLFWFVMFVCSAQCIICIVLYCTVLYCVVFYGIVLSCCVVFVLCCLAPFCVVLLCLVLYCIILFSCVLAVDIIFPIVGAWLISDFVISQVGRFSKAALHDCLDVCVHFCCSLPQIS